MQAHDARDVPRGIVTILLADVEGSVRHWEADPAGTARALALLDAVADEAITRYEGVRPVEQGEGDSFVAAFERPSDALSCALEIQQRLLAPPDDSARPALRVRMALHTGEALLRGSGNYSGALVNRAARLRSLAHGGQVLVSGATHELVSDALPPGSSLNDLGPHELRDLSGPQRVFQLVHASLRAEFPPLRSRNAATSNLPARLTAFIGRVQELRKVRKLLHEHRLVSLTGPGGTGKTRLAIEVADEVADDHTGGVWFVDLATVTDPAALPEHVARTLHLRDEDARTPVERITAHIADDAFLLVLDNCEHVVGAAAALADGLLRSCARLHVLTTSREPLNVGGEATFAVPPLGVPAHDRDAAAAAGYDAVRLFADRAHLADPEFALNEVTIPVVASLCARLDGLALAIELAASRLRVMPLEAVAAELDRGLRFLSGGPRTAHPCQRSLEACIAWSHDSLDPAERIMFRRLAVFPGSFALDAVEAVCGDELPRGSVVQTLLGLADRSLVSPCGGGRYAMLSTIREFARERCAESDEDEDRLRKRHLAFLAGLAERSEDGLIGPDGRRWLEQMRAEVPNIEAALAAARSTDREGGLRLAAGLVPFSMADGNLLRGWRWLEPFLEGPGDASILAKARFGAALLVFFCGEMAVALGAPAHLAEAKRLYEELEDTRGVARVNALQGALASGMGASESAQAQLEEGIAGLRASGDWYWLAAVSGFIGFLLVQRGSAAAGMPYIAEGRAIAEAHDSSHLILAADQWLAAAHGMLGDYRRSLELAQRCLADQHAVHDPDMGSFMNFVIGDAYLHLGDLDAAELHALRSAEAGERHNITFHAALGHNLAGRVALVRDDAGRALEHFRRAIDLVTGTPFVPRHTAGLVSALLELGRTDEARDALSAALGIARAMGPSSDLIRLLLQAATLERAAGDLAAAETALRQAIGLLRTIVNRSLAVAALTMLAEIAAAHRSDAEAARLYAAAERLRTELGLAERRTDLDLDAVRERLGDEAFELAMGDGAAMSLEDALRYIERGRGARKRPSSGWASLTPTELEVVRLVIEGLTNPEIGARMFITKGTVRSHLTHVFAKLGVSSRAQLAAEAARRALA